MANLNTTIHQINFQPVSNYLKLKIKNNQL